MAIIWYCSLLSGWVKWWRMPEDKKREGHHNVYYDTCDAPFGTHDIEVVDSLTGPLGLWTWLESVEASTGARAVTIPHAMQFTGQQLRSESPGTSDAGGNLL